MSTRFKTLTGTAASRDADVEITEVSAIVVACIPDHRGYLRCERVELVLDGALGGRPRVLAAGLSVGGRRVTVPELLDWLVGRGRYGVTVALHRRRGSTDYDRAGFTEFEADYW